jgi:diguanylate cyclase (GGDEF)-like protein/PAS domain S-box-containing protein
MDLQLADSVFTYAREGIMIVSADRVVVDVNAAFTRITERSAQSVVGKQVFDAFPRFLQSVDTQLIWDQVRTYGAWQGDLRSEISAQTGHVFSLYVQAVGGDSFQNPTHFLCFLTDIGRYERREQRLRSLAETDALTGLANRSLLLSTVSETIDRAMAGGDAPSILFLDLDGFKSVNDSLGHGQGDLLLREVAQRLQECVRSQDLVARLGGDEFVVLLTGASRNAQMETAQRIVNRVIFSIEGDDGVRVNVSCSVGIASYPHDGGDVVSLLKSADRAMYCVKGDGKHGYCFASPDPADTTR